MSAAALLLSACLSSAAPSPTFNPELERFVAAREGEFGQIPDARKQELVPLISYIREQATAGRPIRLTFICTHNSRRSHLSQVWARTAAARSGVANVETFSGGTEATAFNPRAVAALRRAGFLIPEQLEVGNPRYELRWSADAEPMICFSKKFGQPPNPSKGFAAVMTCTQADQACPVVAGADVRISLPYEDPKVSDNTPDEQRIYDERTAQIARELLYAFAEAVRG